MTRKQIVNRNEILSHARDCFGSACGLASLERFVGGVRKQTFIVQTQRPSTRCLLVVWSSDISYFAEREDAGFEESQSDAVAPLAFRAHTEYLTNLGVNVPTIFHFGQLESNHHFAFVELIEGSDYDRFRSGATPSARTAVVSEFARQIQRLHAVQRTYPGGVLESASLDRPSPVDESWDVALVELRAAAESEPFMTEHHDRIREMLGSLRGAIKPRTTYNLVHGELDPSHVLVRESDDAVFLVDIEGIAFADLESEHAFLKWRFTEDDYRSLARDDLDEERTAYYKLRMHVSLVYAGSRLMMRNHPARELAQRILTGNLAEVRRIIDTP